MQKFHEKMYQDALEYAGLSGKNEQVFAIVNGKLRKGTAKYFSTHDLNPWLAVNPGPTYKRNKKEDIETLINFCYDIDMKEDKNGNFNMEQFTSCMKYFHKMLRELNLIPPYTPLDCSGRGFHDIIALIPIKVKNMNLLNKAVQDIFKTHFVPIFEKACKKYEIKAKIECNDTARVLSMPGCWRPGKPNDPECLKNGFLRHYVDYNPEKPPKRVEWKYLTELILERYNQLEISAEFPQEKNYKIENTYSYTQITKIDEFENSPEFTDIEKLQITSRHKRGENIFTKINDTIEKFSFYTDKRHIIHTQTIGSLIRFYDKTETILKLIPRIAKYIDEHIGDGKKFSGRQEKQAYECALYYQQKEKIVAYIPLPEKRKNKVLFSEETMNAVTHWFTTNITVIKGERLEKTAAYEDFLSTEQIQISKRVFTRILKNIFSLSDSKRYYIDISLNNNNNISSNNSSHCNIEVSSQVTPALPPSTIKRKGQNLKNDVSDKAGLISKHTFENVKKKRTNEKMKNKSTKKAQRKFKIGRIVDKKEKEIYENTENYCIAAIEYDGFSKEILMKLLKDCDERHIEFSVDLCFVKLSYKNGERYIEIEGDYNCLNDETCNDIDAYSQNIKNKGSIFYCHNMNDNSVCSMPFLFGSENSIQTYLKDVYDLDIGNFTVIDAI